MGSRNLLSIPPNYQQRRLAGSKLDVANLPDLAIPVKNRTSHQIADVSRAGIKLCPFALRNLQLTANKRLGGGNRVNAS